MNNYLIFRTDRIGDFLISAILIKNIKKNDPKSNITIIGSEKNYNYIRKFPYVDNIFKLRNNFFDKLKLIFKLRKSKYKNIIIHDNKRRSKIISFFLKSDRVFKYDGSNQLPHIDLIKKILNQLNFSFFEESLNTLNHNKANKNTKINNFIQLHFDEKWIYKDYIKKYVNIEPTKDQLEKFIYNIKEKNNKKIIITTGIIFPEILKKNFDFFNNIDIQIMQNLDFSELEKITSKSKLLISCHGAISHVAAANNIKQIDIIDASYDYNRWTKHFRNYKFVFRNKFDFLTGKILEKV